MENNYQNDDRYLQARKRVQEIKGFYGHLTSYILVNIFFLVINLATTPNELWFYWPTLGWGIGVIIHGMRAFNYMPFFGKEWEEQKIKEFMEKEKESKRKFN